MTPLTERAGGTVPEPEEINGIRQNILAKEYAGIFMRLMNDVTNIAAHPTSRFGMEIVGCSHCRTELFKFFGVFEYNGPEGTDDNPIIVTLTKKVLVDYVNATVTHLLNNPACLVKTRDDMMRRMEGNG